MDNSIILYTIVETKLAKYLASQSEKKVVPCFGVLGNLILSFSKLLNQKAIHKPSAQHVLDEDYYKRIEAIQFTMSHDDGKKIDDIENADVVLLGVSRTSKTPTSIYLANRGYKTVNIPLVLEQKIPNGLVNNNKSCIIGLIAAPAILAANASLDLKDRLTASELSKACGGKGITPQQIAGDVAVNGSLGFILQGTNFSIYPGGNEVPVSTAAEAATN